MGLHRDADRWGWQTAWIERAWSNDASSVTRWFCLTVLVESGDDTTVILRRVLGWDMSAPPTWISPSGYGRVSTRLEPLRVIEFPDVLDDDTRRGVPLSEFEVRRVELPVSDWNKSVSAEDWGLRVPTVLYEVWASREANARARDVWSELTTEERDAAGISPEVRGYFASTVVLVPQVRPYFARHGDLIVPGDQAQSGKLRLISEVRDGSIILARTTGPLEPEPFRRLEPHDAVRYLRLHYPRADLSELHTLPIDRNAEMLAAYPRDAHGRSGSDWRITVVGIEDEICDAIEVGLIRGIGDNYFTGEPWKDRAPALGFSAPARVGYVPPFEEAAGIAFDKLYRAGGPADVCDPYAEPLNLKRLEDILRGGRLLIKRNGKKNSKKKGSKNSKKRKRKRKSNWKTEDEKLQDLKEWAGKHDVTVRTVEDLHDRFIIGPRRAFLVGTSLNGLGKSHAFIVELDAVMQAEVVRMFEELWSSASPA